MTVYLIDEDWAKADPTQAKNAGYSGIIGYVSQDTSGKNLSAKDVQAIHGAGLDVGIVYEFNPSSALGGGYEAQIDAGIAIQHAKDLGVPAGVCLYAAVDFDATSPQMSTVQAYALGFQSVCSNAGYRAGIYGSYAVCHYLATHGYTGLLWQTYAWSSGMWEPTAVIRQTQNGIIVGGATVDKDTTSVADWGQWKSGVVMSDADIPDTHRLANNADKYGWLGWSMADPITGVLGSDGKPVSVPNVLAQVLTDIKTKVDGFQPASIDSTALAQALINNPAFMGALAQVSAKALADALKTWVDGLPTG